MNRLQKVINLHLNLQDTQNQSIIFSSYPGTFFSIDDFYIIHNVRKSDNGTTNFALLETTYNNFNDSLYNLMTPQSVLTWMRCQLANYNLAYSDNWTVFFKRELSLTYNNNYLLLDYQKFEDTKNNCKKCTTNDLLNQLKITEDILTTIEMADLTTTVDWDATSFLYTQNFYASLNSPVNISIDQFYNYPNNDPYYDYNTSRRLCTSKHVLGIQNVSNLSEFQSFMRDNRYQNDTWGC